MTYFVSPADARKYTLNEENTVASVLQNVALVLATPQGTVPMYREFGIDTTMIVDRPVPAAKALMLTAVREAVQRFEPRADVLRVTFRQDKADPGRLIPTVEVDVVEQ